MALTFIITPHKRGITMPFKITPPLYYVWQGMKGRCYNPNLKQFHDYGGRGIRVCDRWLTDYATFESDMGIRPKGTSIDRYPDPDGDYSPENCRWATRKMQQRNQRRTKKFTIDGVEYLAVELSEKYGIKTDTIMARANKGFPLDIIVSHSMAPHIVSVEGKIRRKAGQIKGMNKRIHCKKGHEYTEENTARAKEGWRVCVTCRKAKIARRPPQKSKIHA
jgi:hypothetical protein